MIGLAVAGGAAAAPLRVCFNEHDAPRADRTAGDAAGGFDVEVMRLVADRMGRPLEPVWIANEADLTDIDTSDLPLKPLLKGQCDAVASVPGPLALRGLNGKIALSRPYYGVGFELVGPGSLPNDLTALKGRRVSVQNASVANLVAVSLGYDWTAQPTTKAQLQILDSGKAEAALVWGPDLGPLARKPKAGFTPPPGLRFNEHVATRKRDDALGQALDSALAQVTASGQVQALMAKYGLPGHAPFDSVYAPGDTRAMASIRN